MAGKYPFDANMFISDENDDTLYAMGAYESYTWNQDYGICSVKAGTVIARGDYASMSAAFDALKEPGYKVLSEGMEDFNAQDVEHVVTDDEVKYRDLKGIAKSAFDNNGNLLPWKQQLEQCEYGDHITDGSVVLALSGKDLGIGVNTPINTSAPLIMRQKKIADILDPFEGHEEVTHDVLDQLPELIKGSPLMYDSLSRSNSVVVILPLQDDKGDDFIASVQVDLALKNVELSRVTSTYSRNDIMRQLDFIAANVDDYHVYPNERTKSWLDDIRIKCPARVANFLNEQVTTFEREKQPAATGKYSEEYLAATAHGVNYSDLDNAHDSFADVFKHAALTPMETAYIEDISREYHLSGRGIMNVLDLANTRAAERGHDRTHVLDIASVLQDADSHIYVADDGGIFFQPVNNEITAMELADAFDLARPMTQSEYDGKYNDVRTAINEIYIGTAENGNDIYASGDLESIDDTRYGWDNPDMPGNEGIGGFRDLSDAVSSANAHNIGDIIPASIEGEYGNEVPREERFNLAYHYTWPRESGVEYVPIVELDLGATQDMQSSFGGSPADEVWVAYLHDVERVPDDNSNDLFVDGGYDDRQGALEALGRYMYTLREDNGLETVKDANGSSVVFDNKDFGAQGRAQTRALENGLDYNEVVQETWQREHIADKIFGAKHLAGVVGLVGVLANDYYVFELHASNATGGNAYSWCSLSPDGSLYVDSLSDGLTKAVASATCAYDGVVNHGLIRKYTQREYVGIYGRQSGEYGDDLYVGTTEKGSDIYRYSSKDKEGAIVPVYGWEGDPTRWETATDMNMDSYTSLDDAIFAAKSWECMQDANDVSARWTGRYRFYNEDAIWQPRIRFNEQMSKEWGRMVFNAYIEDTEEGPNTAGSIFVTEKDNGVDVRYYDTPTEAAAGVARMIADMKANEGLYDVDDLPDVAHIIETESAGSLDVVRVANNNGLTRNMSQSDFVRACGSGLNPIVPLDNPEHITYIGTTGNGDMICGYKSLLYPADTAIRFAIVSPDGTVYPDYSTLQQAATSAPSIIGGQAAGAYLGAEPVHKDVPHLEYNVYDAMGEGWQVCDGYKLADNSGLRFADTSGATVKMIPTSDGELKDKAIVDGFGNVNPRMQSESTPSWKITIVPPKDSWDGPPKVVFFGGNLPQAVAFAKDTGRAYGVDFKHPRGSDGGMEKPPAPTTPTPEPPSKDGPGSDAVDIDDYVAGLPTDLEGICERFGDHDDSKAASGTLGKMREREDRKGTQGVLERTGYVKEVSDRNDEHEQHGGGGLAR
jgi:hypothetical protein